LLGKKGYVVVVVVAAVSASMQQLLAVMHGPGTTGILPPEQGEAKPDFV